jgi:hypothetical protein
MKKSVFKLVLVLITIFGSLNANAQIEVTVCADDGSFNLYFNTNILLSYMTEGVGQPLGYNIVFAPMQYTNFPNMSGNFPNNNRLATVSLPANIRPNVYNATITLTNTINGCTQQFSLKVNILYPSWIQEQNWDDVIAIVSNPTYNGGYTFSSYQWYHNGILMQGKTHSYIYLGEGKSFNEGDEYSVLLTRSDDGVPIMTCPITIKEYNDSTQIPTTENNNKN